MDNTIHSTDYVPEAVLSSIIQEHSRDPHAHLTKGNITPISTSGVSGNNSFFRADLEWEFSNPVFPPASSGLLVKRWTPGGISQSELSWCEPAEALAWRHGILHPDALPAGIKTPIVASVVEPGGKIAWIAMTDVSRELQEFDRSSPQPSDLLISHVKSILSCLARFHAYWEPPDRQRFLAGLPWLLPFDNFLWRNSAFYADLLKIEDISEIGQPGSASDADVLNLNAFLEWLDPAGRASFTGLLTDRAPLVGRFVDIPYTLLHGDLDDRNIGLSWTASGNCDLVLIDWEWIGRGPAAMDVAKLLIHASMLLAPGSQCPETCWSTKLPDHYYESYRSAGGRLLDYSTWSRSYDLALVAQAVWPFPTVIGNILRALQGKAPLPKLPGLSEEVTLQLLGSALENRKTIGSTIMQALQRNFLL